MPDFVCRRRGIFKALVPRLSCSLALGVRGYTEREQSKCRQWVKLSLNSIASLEGYY